MSNWKKEVEKLEKCEQRQDSVTEQMNDLYKVAIQLGFYDAADFINNNFNSKK